MKIKTEYYGVFYKDGKKWRGPYQGETFAEEHLLNGSFKSRKKLIRKQIKKKIKIFRQLWKSI